MLLTIFKFALNRRFSCFQLVYGRRTDGRTDGQTHPLTGWFTPTDGNCEDVDASCNISRVSGCFHGMRNSLTFTFFTKLTCYIGECGSNSQGLTWVFWQTAGYVKTALFSFILKIYISLICNWVIYSMECKHLWKTVNLGPSRAF